VRLRRDFKAILNLIKANAAPHQATRSRDEDGRIVATIEDYATVLHIIVEVVSEGIGVSVSETERQTVEAVEKLAEANPDGISLRVLATKLGGQGQRRKKAPRYRSRKASTRSYPGCFRYGGFILPLGSLGRRSIYSFESVARFSS
jgi:hypothetical protein